MAIHKIDGGPGGENNHFPKKFVTLHSADAASNNISRGDFVRIDVGDSTNGLGASVEQSPSATASGDPLVFGIATHALAVAGDLTVQVAGKYGDVALMFIRTSTLLHCPLRVATLVVLVL